jgi:Loader and inhibitor of phage G40P
MKMEEVVKLMAVIGSEYPKHFEVNQERIKLWAMVLQHANYMEAAKALVTLLGESRPFPPVVGELNQQILKERKARHREEEKKQKQLPQPIMDEESRNRCLDLLQECVVGIASKKLIQ